MSRLASANGIDAATLGRETGVIFSDVINGNSATLAGLAILGATEVEQLTAWSYLHRDSRHYLFRGETFLGKTVKSPGVRGCTACLQQDEARQGAMYLRGHWSIPHVSACVEHGLPIVQLWRETSIYPRYDCAKQFENIKGQILRGDLDPKPRKITTFDKWLDSRLADGGSDVWLDQFPLHAAATFCHLLGHALLRHLTTAPSRVRRDDRWLVYELGFRVASQGEQAIREALRDLQELPGGPSDGPKKLFPLLYERLSREHLQDPEYKEFRRILREHLLETWPLGPGDELFGAPITKRRLHSVKTAARLTGIDARRIRKMLEAEGLLSEAMRRRPDAWALFNAANAQQFLSEAKTLLDAKAFQDAMCMSRSQFDLLVADEVLIPAVPDANVKAIWDPMAGANLIDQLLKGAILLRQAQHSWCHIGKAAARLKIGPGVLARAIIDGRLTSVGNHADFDGYAAVYVDFEAVQALFDNDGPRPMSLERFAKSVGINQPSRLKRLIKNRHTTATRMQNPKTKAEQDYITDEDAANFHERFFTPRTMSLHFEKSWQKISAQMRRQSISAFSPDGEDYGSIYLRADVPADM